MESEDMIINEVDGLPSVHAGLLEEQEPRQRAAAATSLDDLVNDEDLPTSLIVTNLLPAVFTSENLKVSTDTLTVCLQFHTYF